MNIFILDEDPVVAAKYQCDLHIPKMILESAQMLSTAHRVLDGEERKVKTEKGRNLTKYFFNDIRDDFVYQAAHKNHPCSVWCRENSENYKWLYKHFIALAEECKYRFNTIHYSYELLGEFLSFYPKNIATSKTITPYARALTLRKSISSDYIIDVYRSFYQEKMHRMRFKYTRRPAPNWLLTLTLIS